MRRADRLFQIIQMLRRSRRPVTAEKIASELKISKRSVYRDIADLSLQGVPVRGEAGIGYVIDRHYDMPPLTLTPDELEAAALGAQWVTERGDPALAAAARDLISKIASAVPQRLRTFIVEPSLGTPANNVSIVDGLDLAKARAWIRHGRKLRISYHDAQGNETERIVWPVIVGYAEAVRLLAAYCELRQEFRHFRTDRVLNAEFLEATHGLGPRELRRQWEHYMRDERGIRLA